METLPEDDFEVEKSPLREAYMLLDASSPLELNKKYTEQDQLHYKAHTWDYENPSLVVNKVKDILETVDPAVLTDEERMEARNFVVLVPSCN